MKTLFFTVFTFIILHSYCQEQTPRVLRHFMQANPSSANKIQYGNNSKAGHYVNAGDAKIYYETYGKGQPIVILHGGIFGSTYEMFQFIDSLKTKVSRHCRLNPRPWKIRTGNRTDYLRAKSKRCNGCC